METNVAAWVNEQIWRDALDGVLGEIVQADRPGFILYHHDVLDEAYTAQYRERLRRKFTRIKTAGQTEWQERYDA